MRLSQQKLPRASRLAWFLVGLTALGLGLSIRLTQDPRWVEWHLSRLGEGGHLSSAIFNYSLAIAALVLSLLVIRLARDFEDKEPKSTNKLFQTFGLIIAACWLGVAAFPFDQFPITHNFFGYGMFTTVTILLLGIAKIMPCVSKRTIVISISTATILTALLILAHTTRVIDLVVVELTGQILFLAWLLSLSYDATD